MKVTHRKHRSDRWLFVAFSLSAAVPAWGAAPQSVWPQTEQNFRQLIGGGTQLLVFRDAQGRSISRMQFVSQLKNDKGAKLDIGYDEDSAFFTIVQTRVIPSTGPIAWRSLTGATGRGTISSVKRSS